MLNVLLESRANGERRRGGTVASVALHTALIVGAVVATASGKPAPPRVIELSDEEVIWRRPEPPLVEARAQPATGSTSAEPVAGRAPSAPAMPDFSTITPGIPPVSSTPVFDPGEFRPGLGALERIGPKGHGGDPGEGGAWTPDAVEVLATLLPNAPSPAYPDMLRRAGVTGRVVVRFVVDTTGRIELPSVEIISKAHDLLEQEVRRVLPRYRFRPAEVGGAKVRMLVELPFDFALR